MRKIFWLLIIAALAFAGWFAWAVLTPVSPPPQTILMLHPGYSTRRVATELKSAGVIRSANAFVLWKLISRRGSLKAGEYLFDKPANIIDVQKRLRRGDVYLHQVVVPEGYTIFEIARAIEAAGLGPAAEFLTVAQSDTELIADIAPQAPSLEGYLFPETYEFTRMMSMKAMATAMVKQFRQVARQIGLLAAAPGESPGVATPGDVQGSEGSTHETATTDDVERIVIMASIVEKETAIAEERPLVASVYYNRLARNIALDADPSIIYGELLAGSYSGSLHHDDVSFHSRYNTYKYAGLPPGPIANPGKSALEAAMRPAHSDYYYFVADAQGHHRFAKTMEEHNKNVNAYRRAMRER